MGLEQGFTQQGLLYQYRKDRAELLTFVLTAGLLEKVVMPPGVIALENVDLDQVSVKHVLDCARKGGVLELWEATRRFHDDLALLSTMAGSTPLGDNYSSIDSVGDNDLSFVKPQDQIIKPDETKAVRSSEEVSMMTGLTTHQSHSVDVEDSEHRGNGLIQIDQKHICTTYVERNANEATDLVLDLPSFATGLTNDDLRETAYEVLLASVGGAGGLISPAKEKTPNVTRLAKNVKNRAISQSVRAPGLAGLLETMRVQMKISESADMRTREALLHAAAAGRVGKRMDTLLVPLELLFVVTPEDFPDVKLFLEWERRQLHLLEEGLVNHPYTRCDMSDRLGGELRMLVGRIEHSQMLRATPIAQVQYADSLKSLRGVATALAEGVGSGEQSGEFCHWADGYYLNVRLYEMLLGSAFDRSNPGQLVEEVEEILELMKSTWRVLGITQTVHDTCYTWVLFRQFVLTGEAALLHHATQQMKRIASDGQRGTEERNYMKTLRPHWKGQNGSQDITYVQAVLIPIKLWADKHLENYHAHFVEDLTKMDALVTIAMIASRLIADERDQIGSNKLPSTAADTVAVAKQAKDYISSSITHAFEHILEILESKWECHSEHPLALLAAEVTELAKADASMFIPILARWHPQAQAVSASLLHSLYFDELKPFVEGVSDLSDEVVSVLPAADKLEGFLRRLVYSVSDECSNSFTKEMPPFQVEVVSSNLIMHWINNQLRSLSHLIEETIANENWESLSSKQEYGDSVIKVFGFIEDVVKNFFNLKLPMRVPVLRSLMNSLDSAIQLYANGVVKQLGAVADLIPPLPVLTRYKKDTVVKAFSKKKSVEIKILDEKRITEINLLTTPRLCIFLNTLQQLAFKADLVEENIKERWCSIFPNDDQSTSLLLSRASWSSDGGDVRSRCLSRSSEEFSIGFDSSRKVIKLAVDKCCEFAGTKIIFWDMRESFIDGLYKMSVSQSRIAKVVTGLESVLVQLCETILEPLRDQAVLSLFQASLDGLMRVLLDGGSSRSFSQSDGDMLTEDLNVLKSFFIADGDGLPKPLVDSTATPVQQVIDLYKVETWIVIENLKHVNDQNVDGINGNGGGGSSGKHRHSDMEVLLRVLYHRPDREASKFLKKQYK